MRVGNCFSDSGEKTLLLMVSHSDQQAAMSEPLNGELVERILNNACISYSHIEDKHNVLSGVNLSENKHFGKVSWHGQSADTEVVLKQRDSL